MTEEEIKEAFEAVKDLDIKAMLPEGNVELGAGVKSIDLIALIKAQQKEIEALTTPAAPKQDNYDTAGVKLDMEAVNKVVDDVPPFMRQDLIHRIAMYVKYSKEEV